MAARFAVSAISSTNGMFIYYPAFGGYLFCWLTNRSAGIGQSP